MDRAACLTQVMFEVKGEKYRVLEEMPVLNDRGISFSPCILACYLAFNNYSWEWGKRIIFNVGNLCNLPVSTLEITIAFLHINEVNP